MCSVANVDQILVWGRHTAKDEYWVPFVKIYLTDLAQKLLSLCIFSYLCTHLAVSVHI